MKEQDQSGHQLAIRDKSQGSQQSSSQSGNNPKAQFSEMIRALMPLTRTQQSVQNFLTLLSRRDFVQNFKEYFKELKQDNLQLYEQHSRQLKKYHLLLENLTIIQKMNLDLAISELEQIENKNCKTKCVAQITIFLNLLVIMYLFYSIIADPIFSKVSAIVDNSKCQLCMKIVNQVFSYNRNLVCQPLLTWISAEVEKQNLCGPNIIKIVELSILVLIIIMTLVLMACCKDSIKRKFRKLTRTLQKE